MGCEQILTSEDLERFENSLPETRTENLLLRTYTGLLSRDKPFTDTLIKSSEELNQKLRDYIPSQIEIDRETYDYNLKDDILTKAAKFNFDEEYIIAINGVNNVLRVEESNGNYMIYHDNQPKERNVYTALVVKRINGINPKFVFASPKRPFI